LQYVSQRFFRRSSISCRVFADSDFAFELVRGYSPDRRRLTVSPPQFFSPQTAAAIVAAVIVAAASCSAARDASRSSHAVTSQPPQLPPHAAGIQDL